LQEAHISPILGNMKIIDITLFDLANLKNKKSNETYGTKKTKYSPKMINDILMEVRVIINFALEHKLYKGENVAIDFIKKQKNKINNSRTRYLSDVEVLKLLDLTLDDTQVRYFVLISLYTGARPVSVCSIRRRDIDFYAKTIKIFDEKADEYYTVYIHNKLAWELHQIKKEHENKYILNYENFKEDIAQRTYNQIYKRLAKIMDNEFNKEDTDKEDRVVPYTLRHTFGTQLALNGVSIYQIMELMNHKNIETTMRYAKLSPQSSIDSVNKLYL